jgi:hypothetical protein
MVLLTGVGRSGTRAVHRALGSHLAIDSTDCENNVLGDVLEASWRNCTMRSRVEAMRAARNDYLAHFRALLFSLLWPETDFSAPEMVMAYSALPSVEVAEHYFDVFPGGRLIALIRDGVEVVALRMLHDSFGAQPFENHCMAWTRQAQIAHWAESRRGATILRHERLLNRANAEKSLSAVWSLLRVEPCQSAIDLLVSAEPVHPTQHPSENAIEASDLQARRNRARHWCDEQREVFEELCGEMMQTLGYSLPWKEEEIREAA